jgi:predicted transglutaminase-like cysteine proteinase
VRTAVRRRARRLAGAALAAWVILLAAPFVGAAATRLERAIEETVARFGAGTSVIVRRWQRLLADARSAPDAEKLKLANDFFNRQIRYESDQEVWQREDYWATPFETMGRGRGDCEDFAIAKYYTLRQLGVAESRLRLVYVRALAEEAGGPSIRAHMVLAYYPTAEAEPLILDNLEAMIRPASERPDLRPVFSFNSGGLWSGVPGKPAAGPAPSRWSELRRRSGEEGFE